MPAAEIATLQGLNDNLDEAAASFGHRPYPTTVQYRILAGLAAGEEGEDMGDEDMGAGEDGNVQMYDAEGVSVGGEGQDAFDQGGGGYDEWGGGAAYDEGYDDTGDGESDGAGANDDGGQPDADAPDGALGPDATCDQRLPLYAKALQVRRQQNVALAYGLRDYRRRLAVVLRKDAPRTAGHYYNFFMRNANQGGLKAFFIGESAADAKKWLASIGVPVAKYNYRDETSLYFAVPVVGAEAVVLPQQTEGAAVQGSCQPGTQAFTHTFTGKSVTACLTPTQVAVAQRLQAIYDMKRTGSLPSSCPAGQRLGTVTRNGITSMGCVPANAAMKCPPGTTSRMDPSSGRIVGCVPIPKATTAPATGGRAQCGAGYVEYFYGPNKDKSSCRPICPSGSLPSYDTSNVFVACVGAAQGTNPWLYDVNGNSEGRQSPGLGCPQGYSQWGVNACRRDGAPVAPATTAPAAGPKRFGGSGSGTTAPKSNKEANPLVALSGLGALSKGPAAIPSTAMAPSYVWLRVTNRPVVLSNGRRGFYGVFSSDLATIQSVNL